MKQEAGCWGELFPSVSSELNSRHYYSLPPRFQTRVERRTGSRLERRWKPHFVIGFVIFFIWFIIQAYDLLVRDFGENLNLARFEQALREEDIPTLKEYIRVLNPEIRIEKETLSPLFAYLQNHPDAYKKLRSNFEKQLNDKKVYIHGLTSEPPVFTVRIYEKNYSLHDQFVFEPTLYTLYVDIEGEGASIQVNGREAIKTETKHFSGKIGTFLPGVYEVTVVRKNGEDFHKQTKEVVLFGGQRTKYISFSHK